MFPFHFLPPHLLSFPLLSSYLHLPSSTNLLSPGGTDTSGLTPVNPSRFQVLDVDERGDIRSFVQRNGLLFKPGRGFYEFTKPEKVSDKKEVVLVDKVCVCVCVVCMCCACVCVCVALTSTTKSWKFIICYCHEGQRSCIWKLQGMQ